jgi:hypothetical protein
VIGLQRTTRHYIPEGSSLQKLKDLYNVCTAHNNVHVFKTSTVSMTYHYNLTYSFLLTV